MEKLDFTKRLLRYSAAGAAAALAGGGAQAAIIANTTPQNFDVRVGSFVSINFDGAGIAEFRIVGFQSSSTSTTSFISGSVNLYRGASNFAHFEDGNSSNGGGRADPNALPVGFFIGPGGAFDASESSDTIAYTSGFSASDGNFPDFAGEVRYLGTRFTLGGNTHYGWIGINLNSDFLSGVVTGYAFEACAGQGINAGATSGGFDCGGGGGAVPEPSSLALLATGAAGLFALRRRA